MFGNILKQLWFYRKGNAWLFVETTLIAAASWFLVNSVWSAIYRASLPDGYDAEGVYVAMFTPLYEEQFGYDPAYDTQEAMSESLRHIGQAIGNVPEVLSVAPVGATLPGLSMSNYNYFIVYDTVGGQKQTEDFAYHAREAGSGDLQILGYRQVWPKDSPIEDVPGTVIITADMAEDLFPGENPVGRKLSNVDERASSWRISGVIAPVKPYRDKEYKPYVMYASADITNDPQGVEVFYCFRLRPGVDEDSFIADASRTWGEKMMYGNYRLMSIVSLEDRLGEGVSGNFIWKALMIFLLLCLLMGTASFAWLRTRERRSEIGVRRALGGTSGTITLSLLSEVWLLYIAALVLGLLITLNVIVLGKIDFCHWALGNGKPTDSVIASLPLLFEPVPHFLTVAGITALILLVTVTLATLVPVLGALREPAAEVLKDE